MSDYEILVVFDPNLSEEQILADVEKLKAIIIEYKGEVSKVDVWGKRRLAYQIKKKREGFYVLLNCTLAAGGGALVEELNRRLRIAENVLRHQVVKAPLIKVVEQPVEKPAPLEDHVSPKAEVAAPIAEGVEAQRAEGESVPSQTPEVAQESPVKTEEPAQDEPAKEV